DLHWSLTSGDYRKADEVRALRQSLAEALRPHRQCECPLLRDLCAVPMGSEGLDERVFATVRPIIDHGGAQWWLYLSRCTACGQYWMVAQDDRIYDEYLLRRLDGSAAQGIATDSTWPPDFITYEAVLRTCRIFAHPPIFFEALSHALVQTAHDVRQARPSITEKEIADLLGISAAHVRRLLAVRL
ncbi:MAG: hypothetical protein K2X68_10185, partial [Novosphingobium sp.]|nr:hypothetical protein [Novosphingobium sp.]